VFKAFLKNKKWIYQIIIDSFVITGLIGFIFQAERGKKQPRYAEKALKR
jgi:hypothetical protein